MTKKRTATPLDDQLCFALYASAYNLLLGYEDTPPAGVTLMPGMNYNKYFPGHQIAMAKQIHAIIKSSAPALSPKTWYGMPAYAKDGNVVCFFQSAQKFNTRYATLGFSDAANLDDGALWPVAFALQRLEDRRALPALLTLVKEPQPYTRAFAARGLGAMQDPAAIEALLPRLSGPDNAIAIEAIRGMGRLKATVATAPLLRIVQTPTADPSLRLEALTALGQIGGPGVTDACIDALGDRFPPIRAAAIRALALLDQALSVGHAEPVLGLALELRVLDEEQIGRAHV